MTETSSRGTAVTNGVESRVVAMAGSMTERSATIAIKWMVIFAPTNAVEVFVVTVS